ncbi:MAG: RluA family pseudouridine synthase [Candidatus Doudnabacteria bacterium]
MEFNVDVEKARLDRFLPDVFSEVSRTKIQRDIESGKVSINGEKVLKGKYIVRHGDKVEYAFVEGDKNEGHEEHAGVKEETPIDIKVIYENDDILIVDKLAGMVVHPAPGYTGITLAEVLVKKYKDIKLVGEDEIRPGIVHRLDKDTSGVLLVAKTQKIFDHLKDAFVNRTVKKEYIALVKGHIASAHGLLDDPIGKHPTDFRKMTSVLPKDPKPSLTEYTVIEYIDEYTLVRVNLHTGRTHQIRVHFSSKNFSNGFPIVGDSLYGSRSKTKLPDLHRQFLHASKIEVQLPDGTWIQAHSPLPEDLKKVLENLNSKNTNL